MRSLLLFIIIIIIIIIINDTREITAVYWQCKKKNTR